ncbi:MAG: hypothetical protein K0S01_3775 [Herbinix sp.]|nr:hypothetical protein [Herbinix sp.]
MKLLLVAVNAKYIHSNLAVYSLRAYAKKYAEHINLVEYTINHSEEDILKEIYKEQADVIAFSCYIWNIDMITRIVTELKKVQPKAKIWFGGPEVSYDAKECLQAQEQLDGIIIGEGEQTFLELMEYYVEGTKDLEAISGLAFKGKARVTSDTCYNQAKRDVELGNKWVENEAITVTSDRQPILLDTVPFPYEDMKTFENKIIYYESSRGCPFSCSYCLSSIDRRVRLRSADLVKKELKVLMDYQVPQVKFVDRTFNCNKKHAMEIWSFLKEQDNGITNFHFEISADLLEEDEIEFLSTLRQGQVQFEIGVQSTNPDTVEAIKRKMDFNKISLNVNRIKVGNNIHQHLDLIAGLPLEGYTAFERSFNDVYKLKPDQLQLGFLKILKGSLMEQECNTYGITYRDTPPYEVLFTNFLTYDEVLQIKGVCEMVEIYYNSGQFTYAINYLEHFYNSPLRMYQEINDYYESKKIALQAHSRIKRYEILLEYFKEKVINKVEKEQEFVQIALFNEILVLDLFLREDMKSRPSFAPLQPQHSNLRELYEKYRENRKAIHIELFTFDIIASAISGQPVHKDIAILFDYGNRDLLNKAANMTVLN